MLNIVNAFVWARLKKLPSCFLLSLFGPQEGIQCKPNEPDTKTPSNICRLLSVKLVAINLIVLFFSLVFYICCFRPAHTRRVCFQVRFRLEDSNKIYRFECKMFHFLHFPSEKIASCPSVLVSLCPSVHLRTERL